MIVQTLRVFLRKAHRTFCQSAMLLTTKKRSPPLVVVLGATGVGKSQLAIEIAKQFGGEIISADSMQVYKGLDIVTNKVSRDEMCGVLHHMIDFLDPLKEFTVADYRNRALPIVERLRKSGKMAVIVGGTNYYVESLLWETLVLSYQEDNRTDPAGAASCLVAEIPKTCHPNESSESLHMRLREVDPKRANMLHPNDRRKIERSLDIFNLSKRPHSDFLDEQRKKGGVLGGPLRYKDAIIFWIRCDQEVLDARLEARVDKMIDHGLLQELQDFHDDYNRHRQSDYTQGIFQTIGFKEFHTYLNTRLEERDTPKVNRMFENCVWLMKQATKRYSRYQVKWINKRFLGEPDRETPPIYGLNGTDLQAWTEDVKGFSFRVISDIIDGREPNGIRPMKKYKREEHLRVLYTCETCGISCVGSISWNAHLGSKKHRARFKASGKDSPVHTSEAVCS